MQLNEIVEKNSISAISKKTNISEENLDALITENFTPLPKSKAIGFISILERDYGVNLSELRKKALEYYDTQPKEKENNNLNIPIVDEKKSRSVWFLLLMLGLLAYASWYFFTQFDKKTLSNFLPFSEDAMHISIPFIEDNTKLAISKEPNNSKNVSEDLSSYVKEVKPAQTIEIQATPEAVIEAVAQIEKNISTQKNHTSTSMEKNTSVATNVASKTTQDTITVQESSIPQVENILLIPDHKLWFGIINMDTGKREHFTILKEYKIDVKNRRWLIATSAAPFSFVNNEKTQEFNDAREHYFKVSEEGITPLSKSEYVAQGGWKQW